MDFIKKKRRKIERSALKEYSRAKKHQMKLQSERAGKTSLLKQTQLEKCEKDREYETRREQKAREEAEDD